MGGVRCVSCELKMIGSRLVVTAALWTLLCSSEEEVRSRAKSKDGSTLHPVTWAVEVDDSRPWWSSWLMGELDDDQLVKKADSLAAELHLMNKGPQLGFRTVFKFEQSSSAEVPRSSDRLLLRDVKLVDNIGLLLANHPSVKWASRQVPLTRTKRGFNDPKFQAQWHLVS